MEEEKLNLFIVADNVLVVNGLKHYLTERFGDKIRITNFYDSRSCLKKLHSGIHMVVLDYVISGRSVAETLKSIRKINPNAKVVMHSSNEEVAASIVSQGKLQNRNNLKHSVFEPGM